MKSTESLKIAFYGDDFTGSTDALDFLSRAGLKTILFMKPPSREQLEEFAGLDAIGISGMTRSMTPEGMEKELNHAFNLLKDLHIPHVHYKVCSTFDSSPETGSIGKAIDIGTKIFQSAFIPLVVAAPALGRFCIFGNLFARMGIGSQGLIYRLDRHPSMKNHPVTPSEESDLRIHLAKQTNKHIDLIDILDIARETEQTIDKIESKIHDGADIIFFDGLYGEHMHRIGAILDHYSEAGRSLFSVGSSGVEMALGSHWKNQGLFETRQTWHHPGRSDPMLVASGSRSPVTAQQIEHATSQGFEEIALDTVEIARENNVSSIILKKHAEEALRHLRQGRSVIIHTSFGDEDPRIEKTKQVFIQRGWDASTIRSNSSRIFGSAMGHIVRDMVSKSGLRRVLFAGGDTSSYASSTLGIEAMEMIAPITQGAPLCKVHAPGSPCDGLEVNFKGGQVGDESYFETVLNGDPKIAG